MGRKQNTKKRNQRNQKKDEAKHKEYLEREASLPITLRLNHQALGMDENTICEACKRGDHWDCNLATWCQCDDDCDGDPDCYGGYDPYGLP